MASLSYKIDLSALRSGVRVALLSSEGVVRQDLQRRCGNVRDQARANLRSRSKISSGRIASTIRFVTVATPDGARGQVGSDLPEAEWVERGTGVYGPHRTPIVPVRAKKLRFQQRRSGRVLYRDSVQGQPGKHYLEDALEAAAR